MDKAFLISALLSLIFAGSVSAEERPEHYEGKKAHSLDAAFENLAETNILIAELIADGEIQPEELAELHKLTYTAENSLEKVTEELEALKEVLEEIHLSSEDFDSYKVMERTPVYLSGSQKLLGR